MHSCAPRSPSCPLPAPPPTAPLASPLCHWHWCGELAYGASLTTVTPHIYRFGHKWLREATGLITEFARRHSNDSFGGHSRLNHRTPYRSVCCGSCCLDVLSRPSFAAQPLVAPICMKCRTPLGSAIVATSRGWHRRPTWQRLLRLSFARVLARLLVGDGNCANTCVLTASVLVWRACSFSSSLHCGAASLRWAAAHGAWS